ncbi:MAG: hypothetical protein ACK4RK_06405 [Gemmataceae bacterium]
MESQAWCPQPGDLVLYRNNSRLQIALYRLLGAGTEATHVGIVVQRPDGTLGILEAPGQRYPVLISNIDSRLHAYSGDIWVRRLRQPLSVEQSARLTEFACAQEGKRFNIIGMLNPIILGPIRQKTCCHSCCKCPLGLNMRRWYCSPLVVAAAIHAGLLNPCAVRPLGVDPAHLLMDRQIDISSCWEEPLTWLPCGPKLNCYLSRTCCGQCWIWRQR